MKVNRPSVVPTFFFLFFCWGGEEGLPLKVNRPKKDANSFFPMATGHLSMVPVPLNSTSQRKLDADPFFPHGHCVSAKSGGSKSGNPEMACPIGKCEGRNICGPYPGGFILTVLRTKPPERQHRECVGVLLLVFVFVFVFGGAACGFVFFSGESQGCTPVRSLE